MSRRAHGVGLVVAAALAVPVVVDARLVRAAPACVAADAQLRDVQLAGNTARACFDGATPTCWNVDLATRSWTNAPQPPDVPAVAVRPAPPTTTFATFVQVCAPDGSDCREVEVPASTTSTIRVVANADRSLLAVFGDGPVVPIYLYDTATAALITAIKPWRTAMGDPSFFRDVQFLGDTLFVLIADSPISSAGRLYAGRTGKSLGDVGGKPAPIDDSSPPIELDGGDWLFPGFAGDDLVLENLATGKHRTIPIATAGARKQPLSNAFLFLGKTADGTRVVAVRGDRASGLVVLDVKTRATTRIGVPSCK